MRPPSPPAPSADALDAVPPGLARRWRVLPLELHDGVLRLGVEAGSTDDLEELRVQVGAVAVATVVVPDPVPAALVAYARRTLATAGGADPPGPDAPEGRDGPDAPDAPDAVTVLGAVLDEAVGLDASDVHLSTAPDGLHVRLRRDGALGTPRVLHGRLGPAVVARAKVLAGLDVAERRRPQDGRLTHPTPVGDVDVRVATLPTRHGERITLRLLPRRAGTALDRLGLPTPVMAALATAGSATDGLIVICGPTGAGKTTTLHALLATLTAGPRAVMTIEDPVERVVPGATQTQVEPGADLTFASGLRHLLRHDPDVLLVGEVRDGETAALAVEAARTGHLVLTSLHAVDAPGALERLAELGVPTERAVPVLRLVVAQRLLPIPCPACAAGGCAGCDGTGTRGRTAVAEALVWDAALRTATLTAPDAATRRAVLADACRPRLREVALARAASGLATSAAARTATPEP